MKCKKQAETLERVRKANDGKVTKRMVGAVKVSGKIPSTEEIQKFLVSS